MTTKGRTDSKKLNIFLYLFAVIFILLFLIYTQSKQALNYLQSRETTGYLTIHELSSQRISDPDTPTGTKKEYILNIRDISEGDNYLVFYQVHHYVEIYLDGQLVYSLMPKNDNPVCKSTGCSWVTFPLYPKDTDREIRVVLTPVYKAVEHRQTEFLAGSRYAIFNRQLEADLPALGMGFVAIIVGITFISISLFSMIQYNNANSLVFLGLFSVCIGLWKITDVRSATILFPQNAILMAQLSLLMLPMSAASFAFFIKKQIEKSQYKVLNCACLLPAIAVILQLLLQRTGTRDLRETLIVSHITIGVTALATCYAIISEWRKMKSDRRNSIKYICFFFCCAGVVLDLTLYYLTGTSNDILNTLSVFLTYIIIMGVISVIELNRQASIDFSTGLNNRNKCNELLLDESVLTEETCLIMFDLNQLKKINDSQGHKAGDHLIQTFAQILRQCTPKHDFLGRYGGDEFIAIIKNNNEQNILNILTDISNAAEAHNALSPDLPLTYSAGYALSTTYPDHTLRMLMEKADYNMYQEKKAYYETLSEANGNESSDSL